MCKKETKEIQVIQPTVRPIRGPKSEMVGAEVIGEAKVGDEGEVFKKLAFIKILLT